MSVLVLGLDADLAKCFEKLSSSDCAQQVMVSCTGTITSRRTQKTHLFFVVAVEGSINEEVQLVLSEKFMKNDENSNCLMHSRVGARVSCDGVAKSDKPGSLSIYISHLVVLRCSSEPEAIRKFVLYTLDPELTPDQRVNSSEILGCEPQDMLHLQSLASAGSSKEKEFKQAVAKHSRVMVSFIQTY